LSDKKRKKSIVTRRGDAGYTYVHSGEKLRKDDLRLEAVGTIDELGSFIGMAKSLVKDKNLRDILKKLQRDLLILGTQISGLNSKKLKRKITSKYTRYLESKIEELEKKFSFENFVLPGDDLVSSILHVVHTVARRLERRVVALKSKTEFEDKNVLVYLNRLSDLFFLLACECSCEQTIETEEV
jgi:cob(I)alamin adenosyltransferase